MSVKSAVLLTNLGTPERLDRAAVRAFLREFLSDPLVVRLPRALWYPILYGFILPLRSRRTLEAYRRVWRDEGSPILAISKQQQAALQRQLGDSVTVALAMRYGKPSYADVLAQLQADGIQKLVVLPLYPQYSVTTTATSYKHLKRILNRIGFAPALEFIGYYPDDKLYLAALVNSVREHWARQKKRHLLISFHGLPQANIERGDPYQAQCEQTSRLLAAQLELGASDWSIGYQSRFGKQVWIQPYTSDVLQRLVERGIKAVDVICPGFAADCLETIDEIDAEYRQEYLDLGGEQFSYIPALNVRPAHVKMMQALVQPHLTVAPEPQSN